MYAHLLACLISFYCPTCDTEEEDLSQIEEVEEYEEDSPVPYESLEEAPNPYPEEENPVS